MIIIQLIIIAITLAVITAGGRPERQLHEPRVQDGNIIYSIIDNIEILCTYIYIYIYM